MKKQKCKILIIGANEFQNQLIIRAKERNIETHVFAWECGDIGENNADYFYPISITEKEKILEKAIEINPDGVLSIGSDLANITVNYIANNLQLVGNSEKCLLMSTNKFEMRKTMKENSIPSPEYMHVNKQINLEAIEVKYPCIVKPVDRSGSRGIAKVYNFYELKSALEQAIDISFSKEALIEEYVEGREYSVECISENGNHTILAITEKFTTGEPNFIEIGHMQPARMTVKYENKVKKVVLKLLESINLKNGASHTELKIDEDGNIKVIEIGSRMGGDCIGSDLVPISTGYNFIDMCIDISINKKIKIEMNSEPKVSLVRFIFNNEDLEKLEKIKMDNSDKIHRISKIENIDNRKITDSSYRFGYFILKCNSTEEGLSILND